MVILAYPVVCGKCTGLRFGDITFGSAVACSWCGQVKAIVRFAHARSVPLNASAREALAVYVAPRLGLVGLEGTEGGEKKEKVSLEVLLKTLAAKWPEPGTPQVLEPV